MTTRHAFLVCVALFMSSASAASVPVVSWWNDYIPDERKAHLYRDKVPSVVNGIDLRGDGTANDALVYHPFSMSLPLNPGAYYRTDLPSAQFYGGMVARYLNYTANSSGFAQATVQVDGALLDSSGYAWNGYDSRYPHSLQRGYTLAGPNWEDMTLFITEPWNEPWTSYRTTPGAGANFAGVWLWRKDGFLSGGAGSRVSFDESSHLSIDLTRHWWNVEDGRFVVQDNEGFWVSQAQVLAPVTCSYRNWNYFGTTIDICPSQTRWARYYPSGSYDIAFDPSTAVFENRVFSDIQSAGVYFARYQYLNDIQAVIFDNFKMTAVVPEPATLAIAGAAVAALLLRRKRLPD